MNRLSIIITILSFILYGCEKKVSEAEFEQSVFDDVFIKIVDSTYIDKRLYTCFPEQGKPIYDKNGKWIGLDSTGQKQRDIECEIKRAALKKDTLNLVIAIGDDGIINSQTNIEKYNNKKFIFKHFTELPKVEEYKNWQSKYPKFTGAMSFSHIKFGAKKESGILEVSYSCGGKCGLGYSVAIKKIKGKWIIAKIKQTWIS
ncbi:MAG: hypothetical protein ABIP27_18415 [Flavobacterium circumlabens]|uniref:hypothetical protein n=1 Tax=Flavobacterium circumlabens TaxID=2133765 RepID=UPI003266F13C